MTTRILGRGAPATAPIEPQAPRSPDPAPGEPSSGEIVAVAAGVGALAGGLLVNALGGSGRQAAAGAVAGGLAGAGLGYVAGVRRKYGISRAKFARLANVSERQLANWEKTDPDDGSRLRTIRELDRLHDALQRVVRPEFIRPWFDRPNDAFDGLTPVEVIERGQSDRIWRMIHFMESGSAF